MKSYRKIRFLCVLIAILLCVSLASCSGCGVSGYATKYDEEKQDLKVENSMQWSEMKLKEITETFINEVGPVETNEEAYLAKMKEETIKLIEEYANYKVISGEKKEKDIERNYKTQFIKEDVKLYTTYITNAKSATPLNETELENYNKALKVETGCTACFKVQTNVDAKNILASVSESDNVNYIVAAFTIKVQTRTLEGEPLHFYADSFGDFMGHFFNNLFVFPVGWLLYIISKLCGGYYIIGLLITTLIIRTLGWPIYAKTNDMSIKMKAIEGDVQEIQKKYEHRKDPDSQRMMQMEQARLYKENGIGLGGCLLPFLQFPIFMAIFRAISRLPYTVKAGTYNLNWGNELNSTVLGLDLFEDYTAGKTQLIWIIVLVVLVSGTQFLSQILSEMRQKKAKEKSEEDIPMYKRQAARQQANDAQKSMKMVMYMMIIMMAVFVWTSKAGLGVYWLIGNCYSMLQMYINSKQSEKKLAELKAKKKKH